MRDAPIKLLIKLPKALNKIKKFSARAEPPLPNTCSKKRLAAMVEAVFISAFGTITTSTESKC